MDLLDFDKLCEDSDTLAAHELVVADGLDAVDDAEVDVELVVAGSVDNVEVDVELVVDEGTVEVEDVDVDKEPVVVGTTEVDDIVVDADDVEVSVVDPTVEVEVDADDDVEVDVVTEVEEGLVDVVDDVADDVEVAVVDTAVEVWVDADDDVDVDVETVVEEGPVDVVDDATAQKISSEGTSSQIVSAIQPYIALTRAKTLGRTSVLHSGSPYDTTPTCTVPLSVSRTMGPPESPLHDDLSFCGSSAHS